MARIRFNCCAFSHSWTYYTCDYDTIYGLNLYFDARSGADIAPDDDDENVELEKSNVLLMGPTGSGIILNNYCIYSLVSIN